MITKEQFDIISQTCWDRKYDICNNDCNSSTICSYDKCPQLHYIRRKQNPLTPEQFANEITKIHKDYLIDREDEELCHIEMDNLIVNMLIDLGYEDGACIFEHTKKWYA
jgi:hypothetical protein